MKIEQKLNLKKHSECIVNKHEMETCYWIKKKNKNETKILQIAVTLNWSKTWL